MSAPNGATSLADFALLATTLRKARISGNQIHCCCPVHGDDEPSCVVTLGDGGNVLAHCHAGCDQRAVFDAVRALLPRREPPPRKGATLYLYRDEKGAVLYRVHRVEKPDGTKRIWQSLPDGATRLGKVRRVPYRLPELLAAEPDLPVVLVEGEKKAELLAGWGLVATCTVAGAGQWRREYAGYLRGRHVLVLPDNDDEGRAYARKALADLGKVAASVATRQLPGLPEKGDVIDWHKAGGTREDFIEILNDGPEVDLGEQARDAPASEPLGKDETGWHAALVLDGKRVARVEANVILALRHAPDLAGRTRLNLLKLAVECRDLPWDSGEWRSWEDEDDTQLAAWLQGNGVLVKPTTCAAAVVVVAKDQPHHPVRAYLESSPWDGVDRLSTFFRDYFGAAPADPAYLAAAAQVMLAQAVARVMEPGCKADYTVVLESMQGRKKSSMIEALVPDRAWFTSQIAKLGTKDASIDLQGKWLVELAELSAIKRAEVEAVKSFLSEKVDHFRPPFGRRSRDFPRQSITIATTNEECYLQDPTGNRRFLPVRCGRTDHAALVRDRDQIWAQAVVLYRRGAWWLEDKLEPLARDQQDARHQGDPWEDLVRDWLARATFDDCTTNDVLDGAIRMPPERRDRGAQTRVGHIMRQLGWDTYRPGDGTGRVRRYRRGPTSGTSSSNQKSDGLDVEKPNHSNVPSNPSNLSNLNQELHTHTRARHIARAPESGSKPDSGLDGWTAPKKPLENKGPSSVQPKVRPTTMHGNDPETPSDPGFDGCSDTDE